MSARAKRRGMLGWLAALDDGQVIRAAFFGMLAATAAVLYVDFGELSATDATAPAVAPDMTPILPPYDPNATTPPAGPAITTDPTILSQPMSVTLGAGGALELTGTITPGMFDTVNAEIEARGEYVKKVVLNSPGGSVEDAIKIGALIEVQGYETEVQKGGLCASSCPLIFAGGKERIASRESAIGLHQIYAVGADLRGLPSARAAIGIAMSDAQKTTALITRYLQTTNVDPTLWLIALETPPDRLHYLTEKQLQLYRLVSKFSD
jgi:hypothetical protein